MTMPEQVQRCAICASEGDLESHHLALRANHEAATVPLCRACHREQTTHQHQAGLIDRRNASADADPSTALIHALTEGTIGILCAHAHQAGDEQLAALDERSRRAVLRLLALISDDRPGQAGPRPISNDRRDQRNRKTRCRNQPRTMGSDPHASTARSAGTLASAILPALGATVCRLLGDAEPAGVAQRLGAGSEQLAHASATLEDHPRSAELGAAAEHTMAIGLAAVEQLVAFVAASGLDGTVPPNAQLTETLSAFHADARKQLDLALALGAGEEPAAALDRFLDQRGPA